MLWALAQSMVRDMLPDDLFFEEETSWLVVFYTPACTAQSTSLEDSPKETNGPKEKASDSVWMLLLFCLHLQQAGCLGTQPCCAGYHSCITILLSACVTGSSFLQSCFFFPCRKAKNAIKSFNFHSLKLVSKN